MNLKYFLIGIGCIVLGIILIIKNEFYKYPKNDMLYATKLKILIGSVLLTIMGIYIVINELIN